MCANQIKLIIDTCAINNDADIVHECLTRILEMHLVIHLIHKSEVGSYFWHRLSSDPYTH